MTLTTGDALDGVDRYAPGDADAVRAVLRETLDLLRAALAAVLGEDDADSYGLE